MRILLIYQYFLADGEAGGSRFYEMTKQWTENDHEITVISGMMHYHSTRKRSEFKGKWIKREKRGKVRVIRCYVSRFYNSSLIGRFWGYLTFVASSIYAGLFCTSGSFDVLLVSSPPLSIGIPAYIVAKIKRLPIVFEVRDLWPDSIIDIGALSNRFIIKLAFMLERFLYRKAQIINAITPYIKESLLKDKNVPIEKIISIPNGANFSLVDEITKKFDREDFRERNGLNDKFIITYVGAHGLANHLIQLLDVAEKLSHTHVIFQLIGDGMKKSQLIREARLRNIKNIKFIDPVPKEEALRYILASDLGLSILKKASVFKTVFSSKTFDYMACRCPILMVIDGASRWLVEEAVCGIYAEPENIKDITNKISGVLESPQKLKTLGENGYYFAREHFDRAKLANDYIDLIQTKLSL